MTAHAAPAPLDLGKLISAIGASRPKAASTSSASSSSVSVNPVISVINGGGGSPNFSTGGSAASNPSAISSNQPRPVYRAGYGYGSGVLPLESGGDLPPEIGGSNAQGDGPPMDLIALGGLALAGLAAAYFLG